MQRSALCRSRRELSNAYLLAKVGFDTAENEPSKFCPIPRGADVQPGRAASVRGAALGVEGAEVPVVHSITSSSKTRGGAAIAEMRASAFQMSDTKNSINCARTGSAEKKSLYRHVQTFPENLHLFAEEVHSLSWSENCDSSDTLPFLLMNLEFAPG